MVVTGEGDTYHWLIDKSALALLGRSAQAGEWALRVELGLVRITIVTELDVTDVVGQLDVVLVEFTALGLARPSSWSASSAS